jgi:S1-C subfamily serine protease
MGFAMVAVVVLALAAAIGLFGARISAHGVFTRSPMAQSPGIVTQPVGNQTNSAGLTDAANRVVPGIVNVNTVLGYENGEGAGTGIVLTSNGEILTNNHVVEGATKISVTDLGNGRTYPGAVVGYDRTDDLAVVRLSGASGLQTAPLGNSDKVAVGDSIVAVGNAGGTGSPTAAAGQVTGLDRSVTASDEAAGAAEQLTGLIQIAANSQPGDSGGPLVSRSGGGEGFAIPINKALSIARQIQAGNASGTVHIGQSAFLGVSITDTTGGGALVHSVVSGGPADQAGLAAGDVITGVDNRSVDSALGLTNTMDLHHPGDSVALHYTDRNGQSRSAQVELTQGPVG